MPVRKIPKNYRSLTGYFYSAKNGRGINFESSLERDFYLTLEFQDDVLIYEEQPFYIEYRQNRRKKLYPPDCLVTYTSESNKRPLIVEVKFTSEIEKKKEELEEKFRIFKEYAVENGMDFVVITERDIRGVYLDNLKFLYAHKKAPRGLNQYKDTITGIINIQGKITIMKLLNQISDDKRKQAVVMPVLWHLIFLKAVKTDLNVKLSTQSILEGGSGQTGD